VIAGARRFRAAQIAALSEISARILDVSDDQTLELQIVENSQRQDVHPYEEAAGYQRLLDLPGYDVTALASKCGKSQSHIYARLSLLQLIPEIAEAFQQERITASHANLIARLTPEQQAEAFKNCFRKDWQDKEGHLLPARHLAAWINTHLYLALADAPFSTEDQALNPEAGACFVCSRRTGYNTQLFADVKGDHCLDSSCYQSKTAAFVARETAADPGLIQISTEWRPATDRPAGELLPNDYRCVQSSEDDDNAPCPHTTAAIVTHGRDIGKRLTICSDQDCPVHRPKRTYTQNPELQQRMEEEEREREEREQQRARREKSLRSLILRFPSLATEQQMRFLLKALATGDLEDSLQRIGLRLDGDRTANMSADDLCADAVDSLKPASLFGFFAELALGSFVDVPRPEERDILKEAIALFAAPTPSRTTARGNKAAVKAEKKTTTNKSTKQNS
jgi:ParB family chromosome partitioning protein